MLESAGTVDKMHRPRPSVCHSEKDMATVMLSWKADTDTSGEVCVFSSLVPTFIRALTGSSVSKESDSIVL